VLGGGLMLISGHNLWPRFFFFCMGFALLIAMHGAAEAPRRLGRMASLRGPWPDRAGYALAGLVIAASAVTVPRCYALPKQDFTGAREYVTRRLQPGDAVAVAGLAQHVYPTYYAPSWKVVRSPGDLAALRASATRTFLVYTLPIELRAVHPDLWQTIETEFRVERIFWGTLGGGEVYVSSDRRGREVAIREPR
jgi:hypothetical protein